MQIQSSLTPQMSKKPQMGTHMVQQQQQQQIEQAVTPLSGIFYLLLFSLLILSLNHYF